MGPAESRYMGMILFPVFFSFPPVGRARLRVERPASPLTLALFDFWIIASWRDNIRTGLLIYVY